MYRTECIKADDFKPARFESDGEIELKGKKIPYHTVSEDNVFYNDEGKAIGSIFSYSYFRTDVKDTKDRPVIFAYNGGPGSSSMYVHAGFLGARRITYGEPDRPSSFGPYEVIDNPNCLLDVADLVLVDPVGTGYGMLLMDEEEGKKTFLGIEEDAEALLVFIEGWLRRYGRMLSPKYLVGESYGCTRSATAAGLAASGSDNRSFGFAFDGIVMIGNTVTVGEYFGRELYVEPSVIGFPTYAGVNWFHNRPSEQSVEDFVMEAKAFAEDEYAPALFKGSRLEEEKKEYILEKVSYYTGVSREYLLKNDLKIDDSSYRSEVLKAKGKAVSRYDGRVTRPLLDPPIKEEKEGAWDDATADRYDPYFYQAVTGDLLPGLGVKLDRSYVSSSRYWQNWNREVKKGNTAEQLRKAMDRRPGMRTFFANGWYDLCTEFGYVWHTLDHAHLPMDRVYWKGYPSGHMIYIGEDNVRELTEDIRKFILGKDPTK
ncbi:MAG: hypothetical protein IKE21_00390 [Erysipelotrichaceae bacterium]|nr:hypothetical protein [Erysipelotrichaceae bacterium]